MMKQMLVLCVFALVIAYVSAMSEDGYEKLLSDAYRAVLLKAKRSPSMGLSLAEYMASPKGGENFHFIPSGRK